MEELEAEVEELRERNEVLQREIAVLIEEKDAQLSQFEGRLEKTKDDIEKEWKIKLRELDISSRKELEAMASELDLMRAAFQGDASGWVVKKKKSGREYYENLDTGEIRDEMPEVLYVAEAMQKADKANELIEELDKLKEKFKEAEMKKREAETTVNKLRAEINNLRDIERGWKDTSKTMSKHLMSIVVSFDKQSDEIVSGVHALGNEAIKVASSAPGIRKVSQYILKLKNKISSQEEKITHLNSANRKLQNELDDALAKVKRLSNGIDEEVERLVKPMREKLTDCILQSMKEKAQRLQERRQLADLWPSTHIMPTILMQYRSLDENEIKRRKQRSSEIEASKALMLEIRHNVSESRKWSIQYDEYGRQYYQHSGTGETSWEIPEIMNYKPPPGRDEMGNLTVTEDDLEKGWIMKCDYRGMVYYESEVTHEICYEPPAVFRKIPPGRSPELFVGEAANIVLTYIKGKINKHVGILKRLKAKENGEIIDETEQTIQDDEDYKNNKEDLTKYLYDIETIESLADVFEKNILATSNKTSNTKQKDDIKQIFIDERKSIISNYEANVGTLEIEGLNSKKEQYMGPTLADVDLTETSFKQIKDIVELYATMEEKLERRLKETRVHLKDFSFVMVEMLDKKRKEKLDKMIKQQEELEEKERQEKKMIQKQQTVKFRTLQRMATERGMSMQDLENEINNKQKTNDGDELSSIGGDTASHLNDISGTINKVNNISIDHHDDHSVRSGDQPISPKNNNNNNKVPKISQQISQKSFHTNENRLGRQLSSPTSSQQGQGQGHTQQGTGGSLSGMISQRSNNSQNRSRSPSPSIEKRFYHSNELTESPLINDQSGESIVLILGDPECGLEAAASDPLPRYSKEILETTNNLVNFSLYCGFNNLRMEQIPDDLTNEIFTHDESYLNEDDRWLTSSFFLNITKEHVDGIREATQKVFDPILHSLDSKPLNSLKLIYEAMNIKNHETRQSDEPFISQVTFTHNGLRREHALWKSRQIMAEILRFQLQQEATKEAYNRQEKHVSILQQKQFFLAPNPTDTQSNMILANLRILDIYGEDINFEGAIGRHYAYIRFTVGAWTTRTEKQHLRNRQLEWSNLNITLTLPKLRLEDDMIRIELFDEYELRPDILIGSGINKLSNLTGLNMGKETMMEFEMFDNFNVYSGTIKIIFIADVCPDITAESLHSSIVDHNHTSLSHIIGESHSNTQITNIELAGNDNLSLRYPSLIDTQTEFSSLVDDLRGDGHNHVKRLVGDIQVEDVLKLGHRVVLNSMKKLPNFTIANNFLETKSRMHYHDVNDFVNETNEICIILEKEIQEKIADITKNKEEASMKYQQMLNKNVDILEDVKRINIKLSEVRTPIPPPKEPIFEPFPDLPYIPELPKTTGLDSKGKKKKDLKGSEVKLYIQQAENCELDGKQWDFGERWPTPSQFALLKQAIDKRNSQLDEERAHEQASRDQAMEIYTTSYQRWEIEDRARRNEYEKLKKESRKIYLRLDCINERQDMMKKDVTDFEDELKLWIQLLEFHQQSKDKISIIRAKQHMENIRQREYLLSIRRKLLLLIDARRRSYDLPLSAKNEIEYDLYIEKSNIALRTLRYEILDCKQNLINEGVRLRCMYEEEFIYLKNELNRCKIMKEILNQKICIDHIIKRHKYEVFNLLEDLEKLKIYEADRDDRGLEDTIDNLGERYKLDKEWTGVEIMKLKSMISVVMNKINLTSGMKKSAFESQRCLFEVLTLKYNNEMTPVRDSWCENSDYERGQKQLYDIIQWIALQRENMLEREKQFELIKERAKIELLAYQDYMKVTNECHSTETDLITESSKKVIDVIKEQMIKKEEDAKNKILSLEKSLTEISKECHELREEKYQQALSYNTKVDSLLSLVATLQTTLEHQTAIMELVKEERDATVLKTRLASDRLKYQLRLERKHSANLLFIIHAQRAVIQRLHYTIDVTNNNLIEKERQWKEEKRLLRIENWEQLFVFSHLNTDIDDLFEFFISRIANLAGGRKIINDKLRENGAALILSAFCRSPRPLIRKYATKALGSYGWDGYIETRIIMWDSMMFWKNYKDKVLSKDLSRFDHLKEHFIEHGTFTTLNHFDDDENSINSTNNNTNNNTTMENIDLINFNHNNNHNHNNNNNIDNNDHILISKNNNYNNDNNNNLKDKEYKPLPNASIRTIIKEKRQWALRAQRKKEGPNLINMKTINIEDGIIQTLVKVCSEDGKIDWEIVRNASLAISIASYEDSNLLSMSNYQMCIELVVKLLTEGDPEIQTHGATILANLCFENEKSQLLFGKEGAIKILISLCRTTVPDLLEAVTAGLTNMTCLCDTNCLKFLEENGVQEMITLLTTVKGENFLDIDQFDEIQANASEILANISRFDCELTIRYFNLNVIDVLILSCASSNKMVKKHSPLILGNISQNDWCRREIGKRGGIEALFLGLEDSDKTIQSNILWALCNLMWYPPNQERAGRFIPEIIPFLSDNWLPVQTNSAILIANVLYYNNPNRIRFLEYEGSMELLISLIEKENFDWGITEACLRALLSLSYIDAASLWLGTEGNCIPILLKFLEPSVISNESFCSKYSLEILNNMCIHHTIRRSILDYNGTNAVVTMLGHSDINVQQTAMKVLELLEDVTPIEVLLKSKQNISLERLINLLLSNDPLVRAMASESIGELVWKGGNSTNNMNSNNNTTMNNNTLGINSRNNTSNGFTTRNNTLTNNTFNGTSNSNINSNNGNSNGNNNLNIINNSDCIKNLLIILNNVTEKVDSIIPTIWTLRNCLHNNDIGKEDYHKNNGTKILLQLLENIINEKYNRLYINKLIEDTLLCILTSIINNAHNSRQLLNHGLNLILNINERKLILLNNEIGSLIYTESITKLTNEILTILSNYNYIICSNCNKKQLIINNKNCNYCGNLFYLNDPKNSNSNENSSSINKKVMKKDKKYNILNKLS